MIVLGDSMRRLLDALESVSEHAAADDVLGALRAMERASDAHAELASAIVHEGARRGVTQRAMANALDVPERFLSGVRQAVRNDG